MIENIFDSCGNLKKISELISGKTGNIILLQEYTQFQMMCADTNSVKPPDLRFDSNKTIIKFKFKDESVINFVLPLITQNDLKNECELNGHEIAMGIGE